VSNARRSSRLPSIRQAIQWRGADRLGHGVQIIDGIAFSSDSETKH
jgi:adenosine deaminase